MRYVVYPIDNICRKVDPIQNFLGKKGDVAVSNVVDEFIQRIEEEWKKAFCEKFVTELRMLAPDIEESIKWKNPYFSLNGALLKFFVAKSWIDVFVYRGRELDSFQDLFYPDDNSKMRAIKIFEETPVEWQQIRSLLVAAIGLNRAN